MKIYFNAARGYNNHHENRSDVLRTMHEIIEKYKKHDGVPPETLDELFPRYVSAPPDELLRQSGLPDETSEKGFGYRVSQDFGFEAGDTPPGDDGRR